MIHFGYTSGYGYGYVTGDGSGDGTGYGYGSGDWDGDDLWKVIGTAGSYQVISLNPWPYLRVCCHYHTVDYWREHWREIASAEDIEISEEEAAALIDYENTVD